MRSGLSSDRHLDPPDPPPFVECVRCGERIGQYDEAHDIGAYDWLCEDCYQDYLDEKEKDNA